MFKQARIKLTAQYLLIIMAISIFFSIAIYRVLTSELDRIEDVQRIRIERGLNFSTPFRVYIVDPEVISEAKNRIALILFLINLGILGGSTAAGYYLAGITLKPIKNMLDEQNRFITDASHELRTPLTTLKSEIEVNLRDKKLKIKDAKDLLKSNLEEVNNLQSLTDGLIKLTQYQEDQNTNTPNFTDVSLSLIINQSLNRVKSLAAVKNISLINSVPDFNIEADSQQLTELFVIFLDNAIKYSPNKSLISITGQKSDNYALVCVTDQGMGIDEKDIPHLFDRFYRADKSRAKTNISGYGLGLSIAQKIIDRHHGSIKVKSRINKGTSFLVKIPIKQPKSLIRL